jgi:plastocyanin
VTKLFRRLVPAAIAAVVMLAVGGCGSDNNDDNSGTTGTQGTTGATAATGATGATGAAQGGSSGGATTLKIAADPGGALKFDKSTLDAKAGKVTIIMDNPSTVPHAVAVEGNGVDKDGKTVGKGGVSTVTAALKAGDYEFYCPVDAHKDAGMKGTLTVK